MIPHYNLALCSLLALALTACQTPWVRDAQPRAGDAAPAVAERPPATPQAEIKTAPPATAAPEVPIEPAPPPDLWARLQAGFTLPTRLDDRRVQLHLQWFKRHPHYLNRVVQRAEPYLPWILDRIEQAGVPTEIALLPIVESGFNPFAYSHGRAAGLWQFIPATGRRFGLEQNWWYDGRRDWVAATDAALAYLQANHARFDGDWLLALAAYNAGEGNVLKAQRRNRARDRATDFWSLELPRETEKYVPKLLALREVFTHPADYGLELPPLDPDQRLELVETGGQLDLALAAELAGLPLETLYRLNPGFNRWATPPGGPHRLVLPHGASARFSQALAELPEGQRVQWQRHRVAAGDTLIGLAQRYHTTVALLQEVNQLRDHRIRQGDHLLIPTARESLDSYSLSAGQRKLALQNRKRAGNRQVHVVRAGDSFWELARRYKVGVRELAGWNSMAPTDTLRVGQKLVVWTPTPAAANPNIALQRVRYRVRQGDSLARISQRFKVSIRDLEQWNDLDRRRYLQPGQVLTLYVDVTRQAGSG